MSKHWESYLCGMGDHTASIVYDEGIAQEMDSIAIEHSVKFRLALKTPQPNGFPDSIEMKALSEIEHRLTDFLANSNGIFVGRITVDGKRFLHYFCDISEESLSNEIQKVGEESGYVIGYVYEADSEKKTYWEELYPTPRDRQVMKDMKVLRALRENGDSLTKPRQIDHWIYFSKDKPTNEFEIWASAQDYSHLESATTDKGETCVRLFHTAIPELSEITGHTIKLMEAAKEHGGKYDGWETSVEKD